nr:hypothetical protein [Tanacetum cinerariifolium]
MSNTYNTMQTQTSNALHNTIMEAGGKDRPPMLAPSNYVQWKSRINRYIDTKPNKELIHYCLQNPPYKFKWAEKTAPFAEGIDNDIYSTVNAFTNACEMWKAIERLKQGESINVQDLESNLYWDFRKFTSRDSESLKWYYLRFYKMMNELVRNQCDVTNYQVNQNGKDTAVNSGPIFDVELLHEVQNNDDHYNMFANNGEHPVRANQDNSLRINRGTGYDNQRIANVDGARENVETEMGKGCSLAQGEDAIVIQCYNCKEFGHVARECQKSKQAKDAAYHKEKMLLCKQEEARIQLNAEQADWRDDTDDDELEDQELEAHYMYMAQLQEVSPDAADSGPIFDDEPLQKVSNDDHYNVFAIESTYPEQSESVNDTYPIEQDAQNVIIDLLDMNYDREEIDQNDDDNDLAKEHGLECAKVRGDLLSYKMDYHKSCTKYTDTINALNQTISEIKDKLSAHQETISILSHQKEAQTKLYKTREDNELNKVIELEQKVKVLDNIVYKTDQSVQTMNMLNNKCRTSFAKPEFLKKAQRENHRLYDIGCYNDNLPLMLAPDSDEVIRLEKESRSKLSDLIRPFDYDKLNNLYDLFISQREKSSEQRYFSKRSRLSHINVNNGKSKESFSKQTTLLEKRMDESIPLDKQC